MVNKRGNSSVFSFVFLFFYSYVHVCARSLWSCPTLCDPMDCSLPLSMGFSRQEYWSKLPYPPPGSLPNPGIEPVSLTSPALASRFFTTGATWDANVSLNKLPDRDETSFGKKNT